MNKVNCTYIEKWVLSSHPNHAKDKYRPQYEHQLNDWFLLDQSEFLFDSKTEAEKIKSIGRFLSPCKVMKVKFKVVTMYRLRCGPSHDCKIQEYKYALLASSRQSFMASQYTMESINYSKSAPRYLHTTSELPTPEACFEQAIELCEHFEIKEMAQKIKDEYRTFKINKETSEIIK